jgi:16S rRNA (guanine527-N7)-methyltransferase
MLETDAPSIARTLPPGFAATAEAFVALLLYANQRLNLTRIVEPEPVARLHLLDALAALPLVDDGAPSRALDLGSGGGVPGIVLAVARPTTTWTLVDAASRKADALGAFVEALRLTNVKVVAERAETLGRDADHRATYDLVTARACAPLPVLAEYALPLLRPGGLMVAWKGRLDADELRAGGSASALLGGDEPVERATGVGALGDHRFIVIRKVGPTPGRYPRRPGEPGRRPLG